LNDANAHVLVTLVGSVYNPLMMKSRTVANVPMAGAIGVRAA
jgi:hypothetical protein